MTYHILVVDDEPDIKFLFRQKFRAQIKSKEYQFYFAENGNEALDKLKEIASIDVIFTDINMPVMDGLTLLSRIKEAGYVCKTNVISAYGDLENIRTAMNNGAYDFVVKPIQLDDLEATMLKALNENSIIKDGIKAKEELEDAIVKKIQAEESEKVKHDFLANMSHEIRTPMNAVMGMTNLLIDTSITDHQKYYLDAIKNASNTLLYIINDILDLSKMEAGKMELENIDFSINHVVKQVEQTLEHKAEEKGLTFDCQVNSNIDVITLGDPVRLLQVLINLINNAIKFTEKGSVKLEVSKDEEASGIKFSILDTGVGIPQDKIDTIFESFSQANKSDTRKFGGTGLGLTISKQLVELMGGSIEISSEVDKGTEFHFTINFELGSKEEYWARIHAEEALNGNILDDLRILVVDDNEYNCVVAKDTLETKSKAKVIAVDSAKKAIQILEEQPFDVVLMDVQMPEMNGFEATQHIRNKFNAPLNNIPIIALTASVLKTDVDRCKEAGMDGYIPKPFKVSQLINGISEVLGLSKGNIEDSKLLEVEPQIDLNTVTNLNYLTNFCKGDTEKIAMYISLFQKSIPGVIESIENAKGKNDLETIANQVHGIKSKLMMMGMNKTKDITDSIELQCRGEKETTTLLNDVERLIFQLNEGLSELKISLEKQKVQV